MDGSPRGPRSLGVLLTACALACAGFVALGVWQGHRLAWKEALIALVARNANAAPVAAPGPAQWPALTPQDEYRRVRLRGRFDFGRELLVAATTELGSGYWVLTPLRTEQGVWVLVNRGFVPPELRVRVPTGEPEADLVGLLRRTEPDGRLLQRNDPAAGRWYSRDLAAIAAAQGLRGAVAPYFVDAQGPAAGWPRAGLTVMRFRNDHSWYMFTWFALAALTAAAIGYLLLDAWRASRAAEAEPC